MSRWEEIIADSSITLDVIYARLAPIGDWQVSRDAEGRVTISAGEQWVVLRVNELRSSDCSPSSLGATQMPNPAMYYAQFPYESLDLLRRVMLVLADDPGIWFCSEWGGTFHGPDLVSRLRGDPSWNMGVLRQEEIMAKYAARERAPDDTP